MTPRENLVMMMNAVTRGFVEEGGSPKAINGALLVIGAALVAALEPDRLDEECK
ncbi:MAG: hypothetical protein ACRDZ4_20925 [Egibacteraceae bacterium]